MQVGHFYGLGVACGFPLSLSSDKQPANRCTQQQPVVSEMHEVEEEELLHESLLRDVHGDQMVQDDDDDDMLVFSGESEEEEEAEDEDDSGTDWEDTLVHVYWFTFM